MTVQEAQSAIPVYVDMFPDTAMWGRWRGGGHLWSPDTDRLHAFAASIGVKRCWFHNSRRSRGRFPHYDVKQAQRQRAIDAGAIPVTSRELVAIAYPDLLPPR